MSVMENEYYEFREGQDHCGLRCLNNSESKKNIPV